MTLLYKKMGVPYKVYDVYHDGKNTEFLIYLGGFWQYLPCRME